MDADSHPSPELFDDVAAQIVAGKCLAGGATIRLDESNFTAAFITWVWTCISRCLHLMAGSFIFVEAAAFRRIGGFSHELFAGEELELSTRLKRLARQTGRRIVILNRHPLKTSARKLKLYSLWEHLKLLFQVSFNRRVLTNRDACILWYDGRR